MTRSFYSALALLTLMLSTFSYAEKPICKTSDTSLLTRSKKCHHNSSHRSSRGESVRIITQRDIPLVIKNSGEYILKGSIKFKGTGPAITIQANNVKLNLNNASIKLSNPSGSGVLVKDSSEVEIESDAIINTSTGAQKGNGIHVVNSTKVLLLSIFAQNHFNGVFIENSEDVTVLQSNFMNPTNAGGNVVASTNVTFDHCVFEGSANNGLLFSGANQDCVVTHCEIPNAAFTNLLVQQMKGMFVENSSFTNVGGDPTKPNLVQFGDVNTPDQIVFDLIFKNCTIVNRPPEGGNTNPEGLGLYNVAGALVDGCVIDTDNTGQPQEIDLSGIHIGNGSGVQVGTNVTISNTIVQGPSTDGFYPDIGCTNIVIDSCLATGALKDGIFLAGTSSSTVKNCTVVDNGTNGVFIGEASFSNSVRHCTIINNGFNIIPESLPPTGNGVGIAEDSSFNLIQGNEIFQNFTNITDDGTDNVFVNNIEF